MLLQMDEGEIEAERRKFHIALKNLCLQKKQKFDKSLLDNSKNSTDLGIEDDLDLKFRIEFLKEIKLQDSNSSCSLGDIESFTLGPFTSRFWAYRKAINNLNVFSE